MQYALIFVLLLSLILGLGLLAHRLTIPYPILFVVGGLFISFLIPLIPHLPPLVLDPDFIFFIFLPPLLYMQAFQTSWRDFKRALRPITLLAIGLVLATTVTVAYISHWLIPDFPLAAGFVLGAIISPPDAIAASAIAHRLGLPRRIVTILEGESLVNDSTSLVLFKISLAAVLAHDAPTLDHFWRLPVQFIFVSIGGIAVGLIVGKIISWVRARVMNDGTQIVLTVSLLSPYASYLAGEQLHVSAVLSVVATGLYLGWGSPEVINSSVRLQAQAFWEMIIYLLNGIVFVLIGLQLPGILSGISNESVTDLFLYALIVNATCIIARLLWVFPGAYVPFLFHGIREREPFPDWRDVVIIGWCGMRGLVSLAAALALDGYVSVFPKVHLIQYLAFTVILTTLVFQGLTLPFLIRRLNVGDDGSVEREEKEARLRLSAAALEKIAEVRREEKFPETSIDSVERTYQERSLALKDEIADQLGWSDRHHRILSSRRLRRLMIATQRRTLVNLRRSGLIGDDVLHKIEHELDLEETRLKV